MEFDDVEHPTDLANDWAGADTDDIQLRGKRWSIVAWQSTLIKDRKLQPLLGFGKE